ncbi:MAG: glycosyltransferase family 1 protein [Verrucomicrobiales bacterium]|nr:glycosyltransferase family 1 protein [Verrucomicrobiales bacterium]
MTMMRRAQSAVESAGVRGKVGGMADPVSTGWADSGSGSGFPLLPTTAPGPAPARKELPRALLYSTSARLGGSGLDVSSLEGARAAAESGFLARAIGYANQQRVIPAVKIRSLAWHPVRLLSGLGSAAYYGAKKHYVDAVTAREIRSGRYDFLHTWSGDALNSLIAARQRRIPSVMDIPTWHRNKGHRKPFMTKSERNDARLRGWAGWKHRLLISRQRMLMEYELATLLFMPSQCSAGTFLEAGLPTGRLHYVGRGVDPERYQPGTPPDRFRLIFVGALIQRKGVHHLLRVWKKLALRDAELVLVGEAHPEIRDDLAAAGSNVTVKGFVPCVPDLLRTASAFVFPSGCEGFAKSTIEAAACGLPLIATRESGDAILDGVTGRLIPPNGPDALAAAILEARDHPEKFAEMGRAARRLVVDHFTWDHFRARILTGYAKARRLLES